MDENTAACSAELYKLPSKAREPYCHKFRDGANLTLDGPGTPPTEALRYQENQKPYRGLTRNNNADQKSV
jgi:hypothetical protein